MLLVMVINKTRQFELNKMGYILRETGANSVTFL